MDSSPENPLSEAPKPSRPMLPPVEVTNANHSVQECIKSGDLDEIDSILSPLLDPDTPRLLVPVARKYLHACVLVAIEAGKFSLAQRLLDYGIHVDGRTASWAVARSLETGSTSMLETLIDHDWEIEQVFNYTDESTLKSLYYNEPLVRWLLARGADPNAVCWLAVPAAQVAQFAPLCMIKLLMEHGLRVEATDAVVYAAIGHANGEPDRLEVAAYLLGLGAPINAWDRQFLDLEKCYSMVALKGGLCALHHAAKAGNADMVALLLQAGADRSRRSLDQKTALDLAVENGHEDAAALLRN